MNRRCFLKQAAAASALMSAPGMLLSSCSQNLRAELMNPDSLSGESSRLDPDTRRILYYASLAPSGHNSQPWFVTIPDPDRWIISSDRDRWLPEVDRENRETFLSLGAFLENLVQAANAFGYHVEPFILTDSRNETDIIEVRLSRTRRSDIPLDRITSRRTVKTRLLSRELKTSDVNAFRTETGGHLHYFPSGTPHGRCIAESAVAGFEIQAQNKLAMDEFARWVRLKNHEAKSARDGLTADSMEITGVAGFFVRNFMNSRDVADPSFIRKGVEKVRSQAREGAGWMVITSDGESVKDLVETGRRFQRMALRAREHMIAIHPMTQALEETRTLEEIRGHHAGTMIPQFILRVGYVSRYPDPVSLRRPVEWFVRT